jgi:MFS family permease
METPPIVIFKKGEEIISSQLNYTICKNFPDFKIDYEKSSNSWILDYGIYCDQLKVSLIGSSLFIGCFIGALLINYLKYLGSKIGVMISCTVIIFTTPFILIIQNYYVLLISNFFFGFSNLLMIIFRNTIITDITDTKYRSYFININFISQGISDLICFSLFLFDIGWR